jgi:hypothetical protein
MALVQLALKLADNAPGQAVIELLHAQEALISYIITELGSEHAGPIVSAYAEMQRCARDAYSDNRERVATGVETPIGEA